MKVVRKWVCSVSHQHPIMHQFPQAAMSKISGLSCCQQVTIPRVARTQIHYEPPASQKVGGAQPPLALWFLRH